jgi:hypothetical protein
MGIKKGTEIQRQWNSIWDPTRCSELRERQLHIREVMCTWNRPVHSQIKMFG